MHARTERFGWLGVAGIALACAACSSSDDASSDRGATAAASSGAGQGAAGPGGAAASTTSTGAGPGGSGGGGAGPFPLNPKLEGLGENSWMLLDEMGIELQGHFAYSGGAYDRAHHRFLAFGGGHADGWQNDVLAFDIAQTTWTSMYPPTPEADYNCGNVNDTTPGMLLSSKMPASRHSYDQIEFLDDVAKMIVWSGPTYSNIWTCPGNTLPKDTWLYDWAANAWEYRNVAAAPQPSGEAMSGAYDPVSKLYYAYPNAGMWSYDASTDAWTDLAPTGSSPDGYDIISTMDRKRQKIYRFNAGPDLYAYDIASNTWSSLNPSGPAPPGDRYATSYDEHNDVLVLADATAIWIYRIGDNAWETVTPNGTPGGLSSDHVNARFFYDPVDNVHLLIDQVDYHAQTWAYRYK